MYDKKGMHTNPEHPEGLLQKQDQTGAGGRKLGRWFSVIVLCLFGGSLLATSPDPYQKIIDSHYKQYKDDEFFSAIQVSIKAGEKRRDYVTGRTSRDRSAKPLRIHDLFEIGSITKSFTAVLALKAAERGQLDLEAPLQDYLPHYTNWGHLKIRTLLNMTSGLPNYSDSPTMNYRFDQQPGYEWLNWEMIALVYSKRFNPPLKDGYEYSNTGYILMDMILSQTTRKIFATLMLENIIRPLSLQNTFYPIPWIAANLKKRLISGYAYNIYTNPELLGRDMKSNNMSWGGAAGAIVANSADVVRWVENLFITDNLLTTDQKKEMQQLISTATGEPIAQTDADNPRGFGLGIVQNYDPEIGRFWFYEGQTLGFRAFYMYVPCNQVIISALFNSATNSQNDHGSDLMKALYRQVLKDNQELSACGTQTRP